MPKETLLVLLEPWCRPRRLRVFLSQTRPSSLDTDKTPDMLGPSETQSRPQTCRENTEGHLSSHLHGLHVNSSGLKTLGKKKMQVQRRALLALHVTGLDSNPSTL